MERWRLLFVLLLLVALALASALSGRLVIALLLAGIKAVLVGSELMELRQAHRAHLAAYAAWAIVVALALTVWLT